jgi:hypothetical protein
MPTETTPLDEPVEVTCVRCAARSERRILWERVRVPIADARKRVLAKELIGISRCPGCGRRDRGAVNRIWWRPFRWALLAGVVLAVPAIALSAAGETGLTNSDGVAVPMWHAALPNLYIVGIVGVFVTVRTVNWLNESNRLVRSEHGSPQASTLAG